MTSLSDLRETRLAQQGGPCQASEVDLRKFNNAVKHFRFRQDGTGKRRIHQTPEMRHMTACKPWLVEELRLVDPQITVCLGAVAANALLGSSVRVTKDRGVVMERETSLGPRQFLVTVHPSAVRRAPSAGRQARRGLRRLVADLRVASDTLT